MRLHLLASRCNGSETLYRANLLMGTKVVRQGYLCTTAGDAIKDAVQSWIETLYSHDTAGHIKDALALAALEVVR